MQTFELFNFCVKPELNISLSICFSSLNLFIAGTGVPGQTPGRLRNVLLTSTKTPRGRPWWMMRGGGADRDLIVTFSPRHDNCSLTLQSSAGHQDIPRPNNLSMLTNAPPTS